MLTSATASPRLIVTASGGRCTRYVRSRRSRAAVRPAPAAPAASVSGATTRNSSPPTRPSESEARIEFCSTSRQPDERVVAAGIEVVGVDLLEVVGVDQDECHRCGRPRPAQEFLAGDQIDGPAVGQAGERVGQRHLLEEHGLLLELTECDFELPRPVGDSLFQFDVQLAEFVEQLLVAAFHEQGPRRGAEGLEQVLGRHGLSTSRWTCVWLMASAASSSRAVPVRSTREVRGVIRRTQSRSESPVLVRKIEVGQDHVDRTLREDVAGLRCGTTR